MFKQNLAACINKQRKDKDGRIPVRIRSTVKRKVTYYPTGVMILEDQWDKATRKVINHPNKTHLNLTIANKKNEIERLFVEQSLSGTQALTVTTNKITLFSAYATKKINQAKGKESPGTIRHKESYLAKLNEFKSNLKLSDITPAMLTDYENFCRTKGNKDNTIWSSVKFLTTIINSAVRDGLLPKNPMAGFKKTRYQNPERAWLTAGEIDLIEEFAVTTEDIPHRNAANWFLFSCYCGLRYGDVKAFSADKIIDGRITLRTAKAGSDVSIKVHPRLRAVIDRMVFDVTTNEDYNRKLKSIGFGLGIKKPLTSHLGRHTFSVQFLQNGGSMEVLSKLLGHATMKTTQIYGKITNLRVDAEMDKVWNK